MKSASVVWRLNVCPCGLRSGVTAPRTDAGLVKLEVTGDEVQADVKVLESVAETAEVAERGEERKHVCFSPETVYSQS